MIPVDGGQAEDRRRIVKRLLAALVVVAAVGCSGDDSDETGDETPTPDAPETPDGSDGGAPANSIFPCDDLYADGTPLSEIMAAGGCTDGDAILSIDISTDTCLDGRELHWNDRGWGFSDGTWTSHAAGDAEPPADARSSCLG